MNKKGMLANLIGGFIVIIIGLTLIGTITQEMDNMLYCNSTNSTYNSTALPLGETDSFGGAGGDYHFGGYDGEVKHRSWASNLAPIKSDQPILLQGCLAEELTGISREFIYYLPVLFIASVLFIGLRIALWGFSSNGLV